MGFISDLMGKLGIGGSTDDEIANYYKEREAEVRTAQSAPKTVFRTSGSDEWTTMPDEENQYNSGLGHVEYFTKILNEDFPDCTITHSNAANGKTDVLTLERGGAAALVIELMSEKTNSKKLRNVCAENGTPYLRFYYDHFGWWNKRSYVRERVSAVL